MDKILAAQPLKVPVMLVHSLWDQEDIYGAIAVYKAIKPKDVDNDKVFLVHGSVAPRPGDRERQHTRRARLRQPTRRATSSSNILGPFLAHYLKDGAPPTDVAPVNAFETGHESVGAAERVAVGLRGRLHDPSDAAVLARGLRASASARRPPTAARSIHTSPIPRSPFRFASARFSRSAYDNGADMAANGSSTISARRPVAPMCCRMRPTCSPSPSRSAANRSPTSSRRRPAPTPIGS